MAKRTCTIDGCGNKHCARGLCKTHYNRQLEPKGVCSLDGCDGFAHSQGWCRFHYDSWRRRGNPAIATQWTGLAPCGTVSSYTRGCRCAECSAASRAHLREWRNENRDRWRELRRRGNRKRRAAKRGAESEPYTTAEIMERDGWRCGICRKRIGKTLKHPHPRSGSIDHIIPLSVGGDDTLANVQAAHLSCNVAKGNRSSNDQLRLAV